MGDALPNTKGTVVALDMRVRHFEEKLDAARERWQRALNQPRAMRETLFELFQEAQAALHGAIARRDRAKAELIGERILRAVGENKSEVPRG